MNALREFIAKHTKKDDVKIGRWLNEQVWKHGGKNPPSRVRIDVKVEGEKALVELTELPPKAKRLAELEAKLAAEKEKKKKKSKEEEAPKSEALPEKKAEKTKAKTSKKTEKKASKKELQKELAEAKESEKQKKAKKAPTRQQDIKQAKHA